MFDAKIKAIAQEGIAGGAPHFRVVLQQCIAGFAVLSMVPKVFRGPDRSSMGTVVHD
jgi:hypothetical protein